MKRAKKELSNYPTPPNINEAMRLKEIDFFKSLTAHPLLLWQIALLLFVSPIQRNINDASGIKGDNK